MTETMLDAGRQLVEQLRTSRAAMLHSDDPEGLHQLRVAVRRLRVLLSLDFRDEGSHGERQRARAQAELRWLARALGPARDTDVFLLEIWPRLREALGNGSLVRDLNATWSKQRHHHGKARRALRSRSCRALLSSLARLFETRLLPQARPVGRHHARRMARAALKRRAKRVLRRYAQLDPGKNDTQHRLRIALRKLRYETELFAPLFKPTHVDPLRKTLMRLQNVLGVLHDVAVARARVMTALKGCHHKDAAKIRGLISMWHDERHKQLNRQFERAWRRFAHAEKFW